MCHLNRALGSIGGAAAAAVADVNLTKLYNGDLIRGAVRLRFQVRTEQEKQQHAFTLKCLILKYFILKYIFLKTFVL